MDKFITIKPLSQSPSTYPVSMITESGVYYSDKGMKYKYDKDDKSFYSKSEDDKWNLQLLADGINYVKVFGTENGRELFADVYYHEGKPDIDAELEYKCEKLLKDMSDKGIIRLTLKALSARLSRVDDGSTYLDEFRRRFPESIMKDEDIILDLSVKELFGVNKSWIDLYVAQ